MFDLFWDFDRLVEGGAQVETEIAGSRPFLRIFGFWTYVTGMGMSAHGFTHSLGLL
jgi:hypothetical protein